MKRGKRINIAAPIHRHWLVPLLIAHCSLFIVLFFASCSFDYGNKETADNTQPDIVMENVEYMRMRSGDPVARFMGEKVLRYEERRIMDLHSFSFEQYEKGTVEVNAFGRAGSAEFMIDSSDIRMDDGVRIEVESEDVTIETKQLEWRDNARTLSGAADEPTTILRANGTSFSGMGFFADAGKRTWEFTGEVSGSYIHDDDDDGDGEKSTNGDNDPVQAANGDSPAGL